jgi:hypothetical protein
MGERIPCMVGENIPTVLKMPGAGVLSAKACSQQSLDRPPDLRYKEGMRSQSNIWWIGPLVAIALRLLIVQARATRAVRVGKAIVFGVVPVIRFGVLFGLVVIVVFTIRDFGSSPTWLRILAFIIVVLGCMAWPATFIVTENALVHSIWWRRTVTIPWAEVVQVERTKAHDLNVYGANGQCLSFTRYHVDPDRFQAEVLRRAKLRGLVSSSATTSLNI